MYYISYDFSGTNLTQRKSNHLMAFFYHKNLKFFYLILQLETIFFVLFIFLFTIVSIVSMHMSVLIFALTIIIK